MSQRRFVLAIVIMCAASALHGQTYSTNFDSFPSGTLAENLTVPGITFTPNPAGSWEVAPTFFTGLQGQMLYEPSTTGSLDIAFATPVTSVAFDFAQDSLTQGATALVVQLFNGQTQVASLRQPTTFIGMQYAEGAVRIGTAAAFDR